MSLETPKQDTKSINIAKLTEEEAAAKNLSVCENLLNYVREWTSKSSLHGTYYIFEPNRSKCERIYWILVIAFSAFICFHAINEISIGFLKSPRFPIRTWGPIDISETPFPAVTICPEIKPRLKMHNFTDYYRKILKDPKSLNSKDFKMFEMISLVCKDDPNYIQNGSAYLKLNSTEFLREIAPKIEDIFKKCVWNRAHKNCKKIFSPILTDEGVCFTFNMMSLEDIFNNNVKYDDRFATPDKKRNGWTLRNGYSTFDKSHPFPLPAVSAGLNRGLTLYLRTNPRDIDRVCKKGMQGFKIQLHNPREYPNFEREYFRAPLNKEITIGVVPNMITSDEELIFYHPTSIGCSFPDDVDYKLGFYRQYTHNHCEMECLAKHVKEKCDCVEYYMPRDENTNICGIGNKKCAKDAYSSNECDCLPGCFALTYNTEISQYDFQETTESGDFLTKVTIYFKHGDFMAFERGEGEFPLQLLANLGGIISFFLGISFLYVAEIFYFLTLRCLCNARRYGNQIWSGSNDDIDRQSDSINLNN